MYHGHFNGTHYEIGFRWGALLAKHGNFILENIGFPITSERLEFSKSCIPVYEQYFPEILEEIQGIADGQKCDVSTTEKLERILFGLLSMTLQINESFALRVILPDESLKKILASISKMSESNSGMKPELLSSKTIEISFISIAIPHPHRVLTTFHNL